MLTRNTESYSSLDDDERPARDERPRSGIGALTDLRAIILLLRLRGWLIGVVAVATLLLGAAVITILPPKYRSTAVVLVDPRQTRVTNTEVVMPGIGADAAAVESQVEIIESSPIARKVISRLNLANDPDFAGSSLSETIGDSLAAVFGSGGKPLAETRANRLEYKFQSGLSVRRRGLTYVIEIGYASRDPAKAARIANAVADAYLDDQRAAKADVTTRASEWLNQRIEEMRQRLRDSENAVATYKAANNLVDVTQGNKLISRQIEDLTQQLALSRTRTADAGARLERVQQATRNSTDPAALAEALQSPVIAALRAQYAEAARMEAEYNALYGNRYPGLVGVRAQLSDLRKQIDREIVRISDGVRNDYQAAKDRETTLEAELDRLKTQAGTLSDADVKLRELEREAQANRTLFEQFLSRAKETGEQQSLQIVEARIISPGLVPLRPDRPPALLLLVAAGIVGALLGIGLVLLLERLRNGFRSPSEIGEALSLPTIGVLPQANGDAAAMTKNGPYADNLRAIHSRLLRSGAAQRREVVTVVSALPGEGKSTLATQLAMASASSGVRTLLIDGDPYATTVSRKFGIKAQGLVEVLQGKTTLWHTMIKDAASGLYVLGARDMTQDMSRVDAQAPVPELNGPALINFLRQHRPHFDLIIIDSPALLSCEVGAQLVEHADRALLVVGWERTDRQAVLEAVASLGEHARKIAGVVLNKVAPAWYRQLDGSRYGRVYNQYPAGERRAA
jgi:succinoglycan biosynthesis transport protein ExoP